MDRELSDTNSLNETEKYQNNVKVKNPQTPTNKTHLQNKFYHHQYTAKQISVG